MQGASPASPIELDRQILTGRLDDHSANRRAVPLPTPLDRLEPAAGIVNHPQVVHFVETEIVEEGRLAWALAQQGDADAVDLPNEPPTPSAEHPEVEIGIARRVSACD